MTKKKDKPLPATEIPESERKVNKAGNLTGLNTKVDLNDPETLKHVRRLGSLGCTQEECGFSLGVTRRTITNYMRDEDGLFFLAYKEGLVNMKESLRRAQLGKALKGDNTMMVWLGKQILDQRDKTQNFNTDIPFFDDLDEDEMSLEDAARLFKSEKDA